MPFGIKNKGPSHRPWRPDFRDVQALPDTKAIRTGFIINSCALVLMLAFALVVGRQEYTLRILIRSVADLESRVAESSTRNRSILEANKRFRQSAAIMEEAIAFDRHVILFPDFVADLAQSVPSGILLSMVDMAFSGDRVGKDKTPAFQVQISGSVLGTDRASPSQILAAFQDAIRGMPALQGKSVKADLTRFSRNNELGHFDFTLQLRIHASGGASS